MAALKVMIDSAIKENKESDVEIAVVWDKLGADEWEEEFYCYGPNDNFALTTLFKYGWIVGTVSEGIYKELDKPQPISENSHLFPITE